MTGADTILADYAKPWILFWAAVVFCLGYMNYALCQKLRGWSRGMGQTSHRKGNVTRIAKIWFAEVFLQRQLFGISPVRWFVHILIFWGFIGLALPSVFIVTLSILGRLGIARGLQNYFFIGDGMRIIKLWCESFGAMLLVGLTAAVTRRFFVRPSQLVTEQMDSVLLFFLLWLTLSGFLLEWLHLSVTAPAFAHRSLIGYFPGVSHTFTADQIRACLTGLWTLHSLSGAALLAYLPNSKLMHSILAPLVIAMNAVEEHDRKDLYWPHVKKHKVT